MYENEEQLKNAFKNVLDKHLHGDWFKESLSQQLYDAYEKYRKDSILEISKHLNDRADNNIPAIHMG